MLGSRLAPKVSSSKPRAGAPLDESLSALLASALSGEHKSADTYKQDIVDAFESVPKAQLEQAAAVCRDLGNEAVKNERWEEAHERYTSVLAAFPHDHEVLANRSMCALHRGELEAAVTDAALAVNLAPNVPKGFYRLGCALEACKMYKESATVFAKVVELEPDNVAASARLLKARQLLEMCLNVERVNDPLWMHKPPPEKTPLQARAEEAAARSDGALGARRQQMRMARFDHEYLTLPICAEDRSPTQQEEIYLANGPFLPYVGPRFCHISGFNRSSARPSAERRPRRRERRSRMGGEDWRWWVTSCPISAESSSLASASCCCSCMHCCACADMVRISAPLAEAARRRCAARRRSESSTWASRARSASWDTLSAPSTSGKEGPASVVSMCRARQGLKGSPGKRVRDVVER